MRFLIWGVIGAVILSVARVTLQQFTKNISNKLNLQNSQQMMQPMQQMAQALQQKFQPLQQMNQSSQQSKQPQQQANQFLQQMNQSLQNTAINSSSSNSSK
ncbi:hypothetical protein ACIQGW_12605 [Lysinibacillus xylanilyticus]|uniref:hypothetical protein n=1 Tax=Lysinibacillus xylanilyticus TaxID=582475 RepID=UPI00381130D8